MDYKDINIEYIIEWCKENNQVAWLKLKAKEMRDYRVYPRIAVKDEKGKTKYKADKTKEPTIEKRAISFIQIKKDFVKTFMPEIYPEAANKKPTMYDLIAALED